MFWSEDASLDDKFKILIGKTVRDLHVSQLDAAAIWGNAAHECAEFKTLQEIKPTVEGSRGGFGWFQWTGPRRREFESWCHSRGLQPTTHEANYGFFIHEVTATWEKKVLPAIKAESTLEAKTRRFENEYERAGVKHYERRIAYARRAFASVETDDAPVVTGPPSKAPVGGTGAVAVGGALLATVRDTANDTLWWIGLVAVVIGIVWIAWRTGFVSKLFGKGK